MLRPFVMKHLLYIKRIYLSNYLLIPLILYLILKTIILFISCIYKKINNYFKCLFFSET